MSVPEKVEAFLQKDTYTQTFIGTPYVSHCAYSGFLMKDELPYGYSVFLHRYEGGEGTMWYPQEDLSRIWQQQKELMENELSHIRSAQQKYQDNLASYTDLLAEVKKKELDGLSGGELFSLWKQVHSNLPRVVGVAHLIEPISLRAERDLRSELIEIGGSKEKVDKWMEVLTVTSAQSYITKEEKELKKIADLSGEKRRQSLKRHADKYFWLKTSYGGKKDIGVDFFRNKLSEVAKKDFSQSEMLSKKQDLRENLDLSDEAQWLIDLLDIVTGWQDKRKAITNKSIAHIELLLKEIAERTGTKVATLRFILQSDMADIDSIDDIKSSIPQLKKRQQGLYVLQENKEEYTAVGKKFELIDDFRREKKSFDAEKLTGVTASSGEATGTVAVCKTIEDINNFQEGHILIASMTRPEYAPAMKKAAAIVTDEGGITSHAAIVSRELGKPCVIGTDNATRVFDNGDKVRVNANDGVVTLLDVDQ
jgi:phosphohistidine swiveling domain-containing protein